MGTEEHDEIPINDGHDDLANEGAARAEVDKAWDDLEAALTEYVVAMSETDELDCIVLELPAFDGGKTRPYAQFGSPPGVATVRAEVTGNHYLPPRYHLDQRGMSYFTANGWRGNDEADWNWWMECPIDEVPHVVSQAIWALRFHFGIAHPQLLTHRAWGPTTERADSLGLCASEAVPAEIALESHGTAYADAHGAELALAAGEGLPPDRPSLIDTAVIVTEGRESTLESVRTLLWEKTGHDPVTDEDGDFVLEHSGHAVIVQVLDDQPAIQISSRVAHGVHSPQAAAVELAVLNRGDLWLRWTILDDSVYQSVSVPALPLAPVHLIAMLDVFCAGLDRTRDDLSLRLGATPR